MRWTNRIYVTDSPGSMKQIKLSIHANLLPVLICLLLPLSPTEIFGDDAGIQQKIAIFNKNFDNAEYGDVIIRGEELYKLLPEDEIIQYKLAHAYFRTGEFDKVIQIASKNTSIPLIPTYYNKIEDLGFHAYAYTLWQMQIMAYAAVKDTEQTIRQLDLIGKFEDRSMIFLQYLMKIWIGSKEEADRIQSDNFPVIYSGNPDGEIYAKRIIPAMKSPSALDDYLASATSHNEYCMLLSCVGLVHFVKGDIQKGLELMERGVMEENYSTPCSIPLTLLSLCMDDKSRIKKMAGAIQQSPRWKEYSRLLTVYSEVFSFENDYERCIELGYDIVQLSPNDKDLILSTAMIHMILEEWENAGKLIDVLLQRDIWNSENVVCARLYQPIIYLMLNKKISYKKSMRGLIREDLLPCWKMVVNVMADHSILSETRKRLEGKHNYLCVLLTIMALFSEIEGDYVAAESFYSEIIRCEDYGAYLEYSLANRRMHIISPLAAIQGMK